MPMATRLLTNGAEFQVNVDDLAGNGILGDQEDPSATARADGSSVIAYGSDTFGTPGTSDPIVRILGSDDYLDTYTIPTDQTDPDVAPRNDGGFGIVFTNERHANGTADANGPNITYRTVSATGTLGTALAIGDFDAGVG